MEVIFFAIVIGAGYIILKTLEFIESLFKKD